MKSVLQGSKECLVCGSPHVEQHHVFHGSYRQNADRFGMTVYLCAEHHRGTYGVHGREGHALDVQLKKHAQEVFELLYGSRTEFIELFGKSYL